MDLAGAPQARLRDALVAVLFRHPEYAPAAVDAAKRVSEAGRAQTIRASVLAAAALRRYRRFTLDIYRPGQAVIAAEPLARQLGVPSPLVDYGTPCLSAVADLLRVGAHFPLAYERGWQDAVGHVLFALRAGARKRPR